MLFCIKAGHLATHDNAALPWARYLDINAASSRPCFDDAVALIILTLIGKCSDPAYCAGGRSPSNPKVSPYKSTQLQTLCQACSSEIWPTDDRMPERMIRSLSVTKCTSRVGSASGELSFPSSDHDLPHCVLVETAHRNVIFGVPTPLTPCSE
jgi:hypothetical protein